LSSTPCTGPTASVPSRDRSPSLPELEYSQSTVQEVDSPVSVILIVVAADLCVRR